MEKENVASLFLLLNELHSREAKRTVSKETARAWYLVLEPFEFEEVKQAAIRRARVNRFYPEPAELTDGLVAAKGATCGVFSSAEVARCDTQMEEMLDVGAMMEKNYISAGLPHPAEARAIGWSAGTWVQRCREAGL